MNSDDRKLRQETREGIESVGDLRDRVVKLEEWGIPRQHEEFEKLREEIHLLLDHLIMDDKINLETSHIVRTKLKRIDDLYFEMEEDGHYHEGQQGTQLDFDKERQDSKLQVIQLMLSQIYPQLKRHIG